MIGFLSLDNGCAHLQLDIGKVNAFSRENVQEFEHFINNCREKFSDNFRLLSIESSKISPGGKSIFCAGANQKERITWSFDEKLTHVNHQRIVVHALRSLPQCVVCCVDGLAIGLGVELCIAADFVFASRKSLFSFPEKKLGIIPGAGGFTWANHLCAHPNEAKKCIDTCAEFNAQYARHLGIVNEIVDSKNEFSNKINNLLDILKTFSLQEQIEKKRLSFKNLDFKSWFDDEQHAYQNALAQKHASIK